MIKSCENEKKGGGSFKAPLDLRMRSAALISSITYSPLGLWDGEILSSNYQSVLNHCALGKCMYDCVTVNLCPLLELVMLVTGYEAPLSR